MVSKLFELVLADICNPFLRTDDLQFGFKKGLGSSRAIFLLQDSADYFLANGSSVFAASLEIKKAFDRVNHFKLFPSLIKSHIPKWTILLLVNFYGKLFLCAIEICSVFLLISESAGGGGRQGNALSQALFNMFVNEFIVKLKNCKAGCVINGLFAGAIMYPDDLIFAGAIMYADDLIICMWCSIIFNLVLFFLFIFVHCFKFMLCFV